MALAASEFLAGMIQEWFTAAIEDDQDPLMVQKVEAVKQWMP